MLPPKEITPMDTLVHLREYWRLVRFEHAIMLAVAVVIAIVITLGRIPAVDELFLLALLVPIFSETGSFALNDYMDRETDKINGMMDRPLVKGTIQPGSALLFSVFSFAISIIAGFLINEIAFIIALFYNAFAVLYNLKLKDLPLIGNLFIATTMAIPFVFGAYAYTFSPPEVLWDIALLGFIAGLAREIVKSVEDMEGDSKARKSQTLPVIIGKGPSIFISSMLFLLFIPLTVVPYMMELSLSFASGFFLFIADISILIIALYLLYAREEKTFELTRKYSLAALFCGLISLLLASLGM
jgi:geranylgeranylglycerol-phosphate geranylgeranyltransferase